MQQSTSSSLRHPTTQECPRIENTDPTAVFLYDTRVRQIDLMPYSLMMFIQSMVESSVFSITPERLLENHPNES
jgi:hypothetical protein